MFLWTGRGERDWAKVRTLVLPEVERSNGRVRISRDEMKRVSRAMRARREVLLLQIHTHPGTVPFSSIDEEEAADQGSGALAMVVHHYGQTGWTFDRDVAIYERSVRGNWLPWRGRAVVRR
jgi:JAB domain-containing protein similar to deubiquitination enzymes